MIKLLFILACALAASYAARTKRIHYGRAISQAEVDSTYSFVVGIVIKTARGSSTCTGSLISADTVVTAAHCLCGDNLDIEVYYKTTKQATGSHVKAASYDKNREFQCGNGWISQAHVDIGKIKLAQPIAGVQAIQLECSQPAAGTLVSVLGYGQDEARQSGTLKMGSRNSMQCPPKVGVAICIDAMVRGRHDRTDRGDSGGPMIIQKGGSNVQVGVVSGFWKSGSEDRPYYHVYTFFPVASGCQWLQS